jgi:hypothetical protein
MAIGNVHFTAKSGSQTAARDDGAPVRRASFTRPQLPYRDISAEETREPFVFKTVPGPCDRPAIVLSMPKAGTYLVAKILESLGLVDLEIHLGETALSDYRGRSNSEKLERDRELARNIPLRTSAKMVLPGQFAVGHIPCTPEARFQLETFVRIVCLRDLRHALVSLMRFEHRRLLADPLRAPDRRDWAQAPQGPERMRGFLAADGRWLLDLSRAAFAWTRDTDSVLCRFEDLLGDHGAEAQLRALARIASAVGVDDLAGPRVLDKVLGAETLTYSGRRSKLEGVWDEAVEHDFRDMGGREVNALLGYDPNLQAASA